MKPDDIDKLLEESEDEERKAEEAPDSDIYVSDDLVSPSGEELDSDDDSDEGDTDNDGNDSNANETRKDSKVSTEIEFADGTKQVHRKESSEGDSKSDTVIDTKTLLDSPEIVGEAGSAEKGADTDLKESPKKFERKPKLFASSVAKAAENAEDLVNEEPEAA